VIQYNTNKINYNDLEITHICKPKLKHSYISVTKEGVVLKTPKVSKIYIDRLLQERKDWIYKKLVQIQSKVYVEKDSLDEKKAKLFLTQRVEHFSQVMGLEYSELKFRKMKRRWGSCTSTKIITLNTYLYNTPSNQIDYVVVHELAHLVHMNHSKKFHALVGKYLPDDLKSIQKQFYIL
jgi:predicted metal-dependent hydrolase